MEQTLGMVKPEAMHLRDDIYRRIERAELSIVQRRKLELDETLFMALYAQVKKKAPIIFPALQAHMVRNPLEALVIQGEDAIAKLIRLRGASNPAEAVAGTIRGDYGHDQDRRIMNPQGKLALTYFHACDSPEEVQKYLRTLMQHP